MPARKIKENIISIFLLAIALGAGIALLMTSSSEKSKEGDSFYKETDAGSMSKNKVQPVCKEIEAIPFGQFNIKCGAPARDGGFVCAGNKIILKFSSGGKLLSAMKTDFDSSAICIRENGEAILASSGKIVLHDAGLNFVKEIASVPDLQMVCSVAEDDGMIFISDAGAKKVFRLSMDGKRLGEIDGRIRPDGRGFIIPSPFFDIAIDRSADHVWIVNSGKHRIMEFTYDGDFVSEWGKDSSLDGGFCGCCNPIHLCIAKNGFFITAEKGMPRVRTYSQDGSFAQTIAGTDLFDEGCIILDVFEIADGAVCILDGSRREIRRFLNSSGETEASE